MAGDRGASEWTLTGTTTDGVRLEVRGCDLWTFRDGGSIGPSSADNCVELYVGKQVRRVLHPSVQVGGYQQWLLDNTRPADRTRLPVFR